MGAAAIYTPVSGAPPQPGRLESDVPMGILLSVEHTSENLSCTVNLCRMCILTQLWIKDCQYLFLLDTDRMCELVIESYHNRSNLHVIRKGHFLPNWLEPTLKIRHRAVFGLFPISFQTFGGVIMKITLDYPN